MSRLPKITVVTPSYNQGNFLEETIQSIVFQDYPNLEYFIIDGGSTDNSIEIIQKYEHRIHSWVSEPDRGQSDAIIKGFDRATGEILMWVNSDDALLPGCLSTIGTHYLRCGRPDIISANVAYIDAQGAVQRLVRVPRQSFFLFNRGVWHVPAPTTFFTKKIYDQAGGIDPAYHLSMDLDLWMRMMRQRPDIIHISKYLGVYRWHDNAKTVQTQKLNKKSMNHEEIKIRSQYMSDQSDRSIKAWKKCYKILQTLNMNYLGSWIELQKLKGRHWHNAFGVKYESLI